MAEASGRAEAQALVGKLVSKEVGLRGRWCVETTPLLPLN
jgi:hypothetical protein